MKLYNFDRLLKKYGITCQLETADNEGAWIGGEWVPKDNMHAMDISGALIPMTEGKIYQSGGTYTSQDREFLTKQAIPLEPVAHIVYQGKRFKVEENADYTDYADFNAYNLKRVSAFDRPKKT